MTLDEQYALYINQGADALLQKAPDSPIPNWISQITKAITRDSAALGALVPGYDPETVKPNAERLLGLYIDKTLSNVAKINIEMSQLEADQAAGDGWWLSDTTAAGDLALVGDTFEPASTGDDAMASMADLLSSIQTGGASQDFAQYRDFMFSLLGGGDAVEGGIPIGDFSLDPDELDYVRTLQIDLDKFRSGTSDGRRYNSYVSEQLSEAFREWGKHSKPADARDNPQGAAQSFARYFTDIYAPNNEIAFTTSETVEPGFTDEFFADADPRAAGGGAERPRPHTHVRHLRVSPTLFPAENDRLEAVADETLEHSTSS